MSGQWASSTRRTRLPRNWATLRYHTLKRDSWRCVQCGALATDVDHIIPNDDHAISNLQSLCAPHHREKTQREAQAAGAARRARGRLPTEPHPGMVDEFNH